MKAAVTNWLYHTDILTIWCSVLWQDNDIYKINQNYIVSILRYYLPSLVYTPCLRHTTVIQHGWNKKACINTSSLSCKALGHNCLVLAIDSLMLVAWCEQGVNRCYTCICILSFGLRIFHVTITALSDIMNIHRPFSLITCIQNKCCILEANSFWNVVLVLNIDDNGKSPDECWWYYLR